MPDRNELEAIRLATLTARVKELEILASRILDACESGFMKAHDADALSAIEDLSAALNKEPTT